MPQVTQRVEPPRGGPQGWIFLFVTRPAPATEPAPQMPCHAPQKPPTHLTPPTGATVFPRDAPSPTPKKKRQIPRGSQAEQGPASNRKLTQREKGAISGLSAGGLIVFCSSLSNKGENQLGRRSPTSTTPDSWGTSLSTYPGIQEILLQVSFIGDFGSKAHSLSINNR